MPLGLGQKEIKYMHETVRPCTLADVRKELQMWQAWTVKEDGSPHGLEREHETDNDRQYWLCRNCWGEFWYWPEVQQHFADATTAMAAAV